MSRPPRAKRKASRKGKGAKNTNEQDDEEQEEERRAPAAAVAAASSSARARRSQADGFSAIYFQAPRECVVSTKPHALELRVSVVGKARKPPSVSLYSLAVKLGNGKVLKRTNEVTTVAGARLALQSPPAAAASSSAAAAATAAPAAAAAATAAPSTVEPNEDRSIGTSTIDVVDLGVALPGAMNGQPLLSPEAGEDGTFGLMDHTTTKGSQTGSAMRPRQHYILLQSMRMYSIMLPEKGMQATSLQIRSWKQDVTAVPFASVLARTPLEEVQVTSQAHGAVKRRKAGKKCRRVGSVKLNEAQAQRKRHREERRRRREEGEEDDDSDRDGTDSDEWNDGEEEGGEGSEDEGELDMGEEEEEDEDYEESHSVPSSPPSDQPRSDQPRLLRPRKRTRQELPAAAATAAAAHSIGTGVGAGAGAAVPLTHSPLALQPMSSFSSELYVGELNVGAGAGAGEAAAAASATTLPLRRNDSPRTIAQRLRMTAALLNLSRTNPGASSANGLPPAYGFPPRTSAIVHQAPAPHSDNPLDPPSAASPPRPLLALPSHGQPQPTYQEALAASQQEERLHELLPPNLAELVRTPVRESPSSSTRRSRRGDADMATDSPPQLDSSLSSSSSGLVDTSSSSNNESSFLLDSSSTSLPSTLLSTPVRHSGTGSATASPATERLNAATRTPSSVQRHRSRRTRDQTSGIEFSLAHQLLPSSLGVHSPFASPGAVQLQQRFHLAGSSSSPAAAAGVSSFGAALGLSLSDLESEHGEATASDSGGAAMAAAAGASSSSTHPMQAHDQAAAATSLIMISPPPKQPPRQPLGTLLELEESDLD